MLGAMRPFPDAWLPNIFTDSPSREPVATPIGSFCPMCKRTISLGDVGLVICVGTEQDAPIEEAVLHRGCYDAIVADLELG